ncbi:MAG: hypothetical protein Kow00108_03250 [Calditrichia bacterium]
MKEYRYQGEIYRIKPQKKDSNLYDMILNDELYHVQLKMMHDGMLIFTANNKTYTVHVSEQDNKVFVSYRGTTVEVFQREISDEGDYGEGFSEIGLEDENEIRSPIPGKVVKINVEVGDTVKKGDALIIVEAMKMENSLSSPKDAIVEKINVRPGENVDSNKPLILLKDKENGKEE